MAVHLAQTMTSMVGTFTSCAITSFFFGIVIYTEAVSSDIISLFGKMDELTVTNADGESFEKYCVEAIQVHGLYLRFELKAFNLLGRIESRTQFCIFLALISKWKWTSISITVFLRLEITAYNVQATNAPKIGYRYLQRFLQYARDSPPKEMLIHAKQTKLEGRNVVCLFSNVKANLVPTIDKKDWLQMEFLSSQSACPTFGGNNTSNTLPFHSFLNRFRDIMDFIVFINILLSILCLCSNLLVLHKVRRKTQ